MHSLDASLRQSITGFEVVSKLWLIELMMSCGVKAVVLRDV